MLFDNKNKNEKLTKGNLNGFYLENPNTLQQKHLVDVAWYL